MKNTINILKNNMKFNTIADSFDYFILTIVIFCLLGDFITLCSSLINHVFDHFNMSGSDLISCMVDNSTSTTVTPLNTPASTATVTGTSSNSSSVTIPNITPEEGSWSSGIRSLFIYGTGAYRLTLLRGGGTPSARAFVLASTVGADAISRVVNNTINDPSYVRNHYENWKIMWENKTEGTASVTVDADTVSKLTSASSNNFIKDGDGLSDLMHVFLNRIFENIKYVLEPVQVNYSNDLLANQINDLSILLFVLAIIIFSLIIVLLFNLFMYINMDKIIQFFNNKYIKWYLTLNKKFISIEICFLGCSILYFMYTLITGIRFIAIHPIIIN